VTYGLDAADGRSLRSNFLARAAAEPGAPALLAGGRTWSYGEADGIARTWAAALLEGLDLRPRRVGVLGYRSEASYLGTLAALLAGATFVPLNPRFPAARTEMMVRLADLDAIIADAEHLEALWPVLHDLERAPLLLLPGAEEPPAGAAGMRVLTARDVARLGPLGVLPPVLPFESAYLLFTSGSTGVPKGVPVTHANVLHFLDVMARRYGIGPGDRLSQTFDQTFDLSVFDLFMAWENGACVCSPSPIDLVAPTSFVNRDGITVWFSVPSIPALMRKKNLLKPESMPDLRWSLFCGEPLPAATAEAWQAAAPASIVENLYGPTELTIACFVYRWDPEHSPAACINGLVPIGRPYPGLGAVVLDERREAVNGDGTGELYVCGPQAVPGYWRAPEKTAERFVTLPVRSAASEEHVRFYATGDRVVIHPNGDYVCLGRADDQIKVLGHRVELGDIEAALHDLPGVVDAIAVGWPVEDGVAQGIVAFVTGPDPSAEAIVEGAREVLPDYMAPKEVHVVEAMPLNANGKIDRRALRERLVAT
jgi:amino acid adenylation domain-containing protein